MGKAIAIHDGKIIAVGDEHPYFKLRSATRK